MIIKTSTDPPTQLLQMTIMNPDDCWCPWCSVAPIHNSDRAESGDGTRSSLCYIHIQPPALTQTRHTLHHTQHPTPGLDTAHSGNTRSVAPPRDPAPEQRPAPPRYLGLNGDFGSFLDLLIGRIMQQLMPVPRPNCVGRDGGCG